MVPALVTALAILACVGDDPELTAGSGGDAGTDGTTTAPTSPMVELSSPSRTSNEAAADSNRTG